FAAITNSLQQLGGAGGAGGANPNTGIVPPQQGGQAQAPGNADLFEDAGRKIGQGLGELLGEAFKAIAGGGGQNAQPAGGADKAAGGAPAGGAPAGGADKAAGGAPADGAKNDPATA